MAKVELKLRCHNLPSVDTFSKSDPAVVVSTQKEGKVVEVGRTECIPDTNEPTFKTTFTVDWDADAELRFEVHDMDGEGKDMKGARFIGAYTTSLAELVSIGETANKRLHAKNGTVLKNGSIIVTATVIGDDAAVAAVKDAAKSHISAVAKARTCVLSVNLLAPASLACFALVEACELGNEIKVEEAPTIGSDEFLAPKSSGPPLLNDSGFKLGGPHAIMRYICQRFNHVTPNWYPTDLQARARVDEVLENHSSRGRMGSPWYYYKYVATAKNEAAATEAIAHCRRNLLTLEERLSRQNFVAGDQMSIADLACYTELGALRLSPIFESYMVEHKLLNVVRWCKAMAAQPWHDKVLGMMHAKLLGEAGQHK